MTTTQGQGNLKVLSQLIFLDQGLHLFRIAEVHVPGAAYLGLNATPVGMGKIDFFPAEGVTDLTLRRAGDCIVVRVSEDKAGLLVTEYQIGQGGGEIKLRIDRVATTFPPLQGQAAERPQTPQHSPAPATDPSISVKVLGHISGRGDVIASDDWIGAQNDAELLEGFAIKVIGLPADVKLQYSCGSSGSRQLQTGEGGEFVGSRGKNIKINALKFSLQGDGAQNYQLAGQAYFTKSGALDIEDNILLKSSGTGNDLSGFRLVIVPRGNRQQTPTLSTGRSAKARPDKTSKVEKKTNPSGVSVTPKQAPKTVRSKSLSRTKPAKKQPARKNK